MSNLIAVERPSDLVELDEAAGAVNTLRPLTNSLDSRKERLMMNTTQRCTVAGCLDPRRGEMYCNKHRIRVRKYGDPGIVHRTGRPIEEPDYLERLMSKTKRDVNGCLLYLAGQSNHGGHKRISHKNRMWLAHRLAWTLIVGEIPTGLIVRHKCDNPPCIDVIHLELGTVADNNHDRDIRGRTVHVRGEDHPNSKLTESQVREIRSRLAADESQLSIARRIGVGRAVVQNIDYGKTWGWLV